MGLAIRAIVLIVVLSPSLAAADSGPTSVRSKESKAVLSNEWFQRFLKEERKRQWERAKARMMRPRLRFDFEYGGLELQDVPPITENHK